MAAAQTDKRSKSIATVACSTPDVFVAIAHVDSQLDTIQEVSGFLAHAFRSLPVVRHQFVEGDTALVDSTRYFCEVIVSVYPVQLAGVNVMLGTEPNL